MRKTVLKKLSLVAAAMMLCTSFVSCGRGDKKKDVKNSTTDIQIGYWNAGLGRAWLDKIVERFEELHPEYDVEVEASAVLTEINANLMQEESDTIDLYMTYFTDTSYEKYYSPLEGLLDEKYGNEQKTLREKFNPYVLEQEKREDGKIYTLAYGGGYSGFCYDADVINGTKYVVPKTTDELEFLTYELESNGITPFVHFAPEGYAQYQAVAWQAQYDGLDYYNNTFLKLKNPVTGEAPSKAVMREKDGRYEALQVMGKIFTPDTVLNNSNTMGHTAAQTKFLNGDAAMMMNGMWMLNEMEYNGNKNVTMMKTPVISSIRNKCTTIGTDQELSDLITDIDAVTEGTKTVTLTGDDNALITGTGYSVNEKDWKRIYEARNIMYNNAVEHSLMIPTYAVAKEGAVEFTKFFFSDEALEIYFKETHFSYPVYFSDENKKIEQTGWSAFEKQLYSYYLTGIPVSNRTFSRSVIFDDGGIDDCANIQIINQLSAKGTARKTAEALWKEIEAAVDKDWSTWLKNAGLS